MRGKERPAATAIAAPDSIRGFFSFGESRVWNSQLRTRLFPAFFLLSFLFCSLSLRAQDPTDTTRRALPPLPVDSAKIDSTRDSTLTDSVHVSTNGSFDKTITYSARDSIIFSIDGKMAYLYGDAVVSTGNDKLQAAYIEIDFNKKELYAEVRIDSATGEYIGMPVLDYAGEKVSQEWLKYNFETGRGVSAAAETEIEDGFFHADRVKRVDKNIAFAENGKYTTCDAPHPHYYFAASKMKLVTDDKIYADRLQLYIEDVPVITLPIGVFFALGGGRHSGILIPTFSQSTERGLEFRELGYFWAINDYLDTKFTTDLTTKHGYNLKNLTRFRLRGAVEQSDLQVTFGRSRDDVDDPLETSWIFGYNHRQHIGKETTLSGSLNFTTADAIRQTTTAANTPNLIDNITTQRIESNFSFSSSIDLFGMNIPVGLGFNRGQDIVSREIDPERFTGNLRLPDWNPFAKSGPEFLQSVSLGFSMDATRSYIRKDTIPGGGFRTEDTRYGANLNPRFSWTPKLGYFTVNPSVALHSSIFTRRRIKQLNESGGIDTSYVHGLYVPFWWSTSLDVSTNLYGIVQPRIFGLNAIRHRLTPRIGIFFTPDFSDQKYGYYDEFFNPFTNSVERYSIFEADPVAGIPTRGESRSLTWSLDNLFEAKIAQGDTLQDKNITLLNLSLSGSYNFADSLFPISTVSVQASTNLGRVGTFRGNATLDPYRTDTLGRSIAHGFAFPWFRVTTASLTLNTAFDNQGFNTQQFLTEGEDSTRRTRSRFDLHRPPFDTHAFWGDQVRGNGRFTIPWRIALGGTYTITPLADGTVNTRFNVNTQFSFSLTPTTQISSDANYDVKAGRFNIPSINLRKDLHDWEMELTWYPSGAAAGVFFRIGFTPQMLRSLEYTNY